MIIYSDYEVIKQKTEAQVVDKVKEAIGNGWQPIGGIQQDTIGEKFFLQSMGFIDQARSITKAQITSINQALNKIDENTRPSEEES